MEDLRLTPDQLQQIADRTAARAHELAVASRKDRTPWDRRITIAMGIFSFVSFVFLAGINFSRLSGTEDKLRDQQMQVDKLDARIKEIEKAQSDQSGILGRILERLETFKSDMTEIKQRLNTR